ARPVAQRDGEVARKVPAAIRAGWPNGRRCKSAANRGYLPGVEIAGEPLTIEVGAAGDVHDSALIARDAYVACLDQARTHTHPKTAIPSTDRRDLPAPDHIVKRRRNVPAKAFAFSEGKLVDAVEGDPMRRNGGVVEVDQAPPLVVAKAWLAYQFDILWHGRSATSAKRTVSGTTIDGGVSIAEASRVDRKSTRLNSSHLVISYAVFCLKKKKKIKTKKIQLKLKKILSLIMFNLTA